MVVCELLACMQPNRHETSTTHCNPYRRVSSRGRCVQICFSRGVRDEKPENDHLPFWFYGETIWTFVHSLHIAIVEAPSWECRFLWRALVVEAR